MMKTKSIKLTRDGAVVMVLRDGQDLGQHYILDTVSRQVLAFFGSEGAAIRAARRIRRQEGI